MAAKDKQLVLSKPADNSLAAYKEFVNEFGKSLSDDYQDTLTEAEWKAAWQEFWAKVKK
jgi:hypothetical protein